MLNTQNPHSTFTSKSKPMPSSNPSPPLKIQRLSPEEVANQQCKGFFYNCDEKYVKGRRFHEQKLFHMDVSSTLKIEDLG